MKTWLVAIGIVLCQMTVALSLNKAGNLPTAYRQLCQFDSDWYGDIAERGYGPCIPPPPAGYAKDNGGFFPGYPLSARALHLLLGLDSQLALLIIAQGAAVIFWAAFLFLLSRWRIMHFYQGLAVLAVLSHPCSFYLVSGYSESLFCAALVLFIYFSLLTANGASLGMTASGFIMTATRFVGLPITVLPVISWIFRRRPHFCRAMMIAAISSLGAFSFFLYCKLHFGEFGHYMKTQAEAWGVVPSYSAVFLPTNYHWNKSGDQMSMSLTAIAFWLTAVIEGAVWARARDVKRGYLWIIRLPWYLGALMLWYLSCSGVASVSFRSLIRYSLLWSILLIIAWTHLFSFSIRLPSRVKSVIFAVLSVCLTIALSRQMLELLNRYLHGGWVS